jgi:hypothetical protein
VRGWAASDVLQLPVRMHGIHLGEPVDVLLHGQADRVLGFEIACGDGLRRFLPFAVAELRADEIAIESALTLIDERDLEYYRRRARSLLDLDYTNPWIDDEGLVHEALSVA